MDVTAPSIDPSTVTAAAQLAPDTCVIASGQGNPSPACPTDPTVVVTAGQTRTATPADVSGKTVKGGFGRWGGHNGSAMCFTSYTDLSALISNDGQVVLIESSSPLMYASRTRLQRSSAVWGAAASPVVAVMVQDATHPRGVAVALTGGTSDEVQFFVEPVGAGPITVTALDAAGRIVGIATVS